MRTMTDDEMLKKYNQAKNMKEKREQITIIAELNGMSKDEVKEILLRKGADLPGNVKNGKSKPKAAVPKEEKPSENNYHIPEEVRNVIVNAMQGLTEEAEQKHKELDELIVNQVEPLEKAISNIENQITVCSEYLRGAKG